jgi:hypothetical protein
MRRLRNLLAAVPIAVMLGAAPAAGASDGGAPGYTTIGDQCAQYIYNYQWWGSEYVMEVEGAGTETPYALYAYTRVQYYGNLIQYYNC